MNYLAKFLGRTLQLQTPIILALLLAFVVPLNVYAYNRAEVAGFEPQAIANLLIAVTALLAVALCLVHTVLSLILPQRILGALWFAATIFCLITGLLLPLTTSAGQAEASELGINYMHLAIAAVAAIALGIASLSPLRVPLSVAAIVFIGGNLFYAMSNLLSNGETPFSRLTGLSSEKNVLVISFDGLSRDIAIEAVQENEALRKRLKDFTFFTQAVANAPSTTASLAFETLGGRDLKAEFGTEDGLLEKLDRKTSSLNYLLAHGFDVTSYGHYRIVFGHPDRQVLNWNQQNRSTGENLTAVDTLLGFSTARTLSSRFALAPVLAWGWERYLPFSAREDDLVRRVRLHKGANWDVPNVTSIKDWDALVAQVNVSKREPAALFAHFVFSHYPTDFDANCVYRSDDETWWKAHQNRAGLKDETVCFLTQFGKLLDRLEQLGVYDRSLIVLKSDHGAPAYQHDPNKYESFRIRGSPFWGYGRHTPLLAIKAVNASHAQSPIDARHIALSDLATTMCKFATPSDGCAQFRGFDLVGGAAIPPTATYPVTIVTRADSDFKIDTHEGIDFPRGPEFIPELNERLTSELLKSPAECNVVYDLRQGQPFNNGLTNAGTWIFWRDQNNRTVKWSKPNCEASTARLRLNLGSADAAQAWIRTDSGSRIELNKDADGYVADVPLTPASRNELTLVAEGDAAAFVSLELLRRTEAVERPPG